MVKENDHVPIPRVELSDEHQKLSRAELVVEHRRRVSDLSRQAGFRDDLAFRQALEEDGLQPIALPPRLASFTREIGYILALKERILVLFNRPQSPSGQ